MSLTLGGVLEGGILIDFGANEIFVGDITDPVQLADASGLTNSLAPDQAACTGRQAETRAGLPVSFSCHPIRAATPGSSLPSIHSRKAPPAVEMKLKLSTAALALFSAATVSPPPAARPTRQPWSAQPHGVLRRWSRHRRAIALILFVYPQYKQLRYMRFSSLEAAEVLQKRFEPAVPLADFWLHAVPAYTTSQYAGTP